jgi:hypothetical protein
MIRSAVPHNWRRPAAIDQSVQPAEHGQRDRQKQKKAQFEFNHRSLLSRPARMTKEPGANRQVGEEIFSTARASS